MFKSFCLQYSYFENPLSNIESRPFTNSQFFQTNPKTRKITFYKNDTHADMGILNKIFQTFLQPG